MGPKIIRFRNKYNVPGQFIWLTFLICLAPTILNWLGIDFGTQLHSIDFRGLDLLPSNLQESEVQQFQNGRFIHLILVCLSVPIALVTAILAFVDYSIKKDITTPIVGVALFCAGCLDMFHILAATNLITLQGDQFIISQFTWIISRTFHSVILILGTGIFLVKSQSNRENTVQDADNVVYYISAIFVLLTFLTINILLSLKTVPDLYYPGNFIQRPLDVIPIVLYVLSLIFIFPAFYRKYPSKFSQMLILSLVPAIFTQIHMSLSTFPRFDNHFNIAHFLQILTYLIPFTGLCLNYLQTHQNEQVVIHTLDEEVRDRLRAEELIKGIFNSSQNGIMAFQARRNTDGGLTDFSLLTYNVTSSAIMTPCITLHEGKILTEVFNQVLPAGYLKLLFNVADGGPAAAWEQYAVTLKKWLYVAAVKFGDGIVLTLSDVSARKRTEQNLITSEKMALTGRFARTIAHEIRNPLTNITLSMGQLRSELETEDDSFDLYFDIVKRNCERINQLITELLKSTKPEELNFVHFPIDSLLNETLALAADRIRLKEITLRKNFSHSAATILVDPEKIKIALLNIIINAVEAMPATGGELLVSTFEKDNKFTVSIVDNGIGINAENLDRMFEPFYTGKAKGTGLGLTSAQNIIINHKGTIKVESVPDEGTEFIISFEL